MRGTLRDATGLATEEDTRDERAGQYCERDPDVGEPAVEREMVRVGELAAVGEEQEAGDRESQELRRDVAHDEGGERRGGTPPPNIASTTPASMLLVPRRVPDATTATAISAVLAQPTEYRGGTTRWRRNGVTTGPHAHRLTLQWSSKRSSAP